MSTRKKFQFFESKTRQSSDSASSRERNSNPLSDPARESGFRESSNESDVPSTAASTEALCRDAFESRRRLDLRRRGASLSCFCPRRTGFFILKRASHKRNFLLRQAVALQCGGGASTPFARTAEATRSGDNGGALFFRVKSSKGSRGAACSGN